MLEILKKKRQEGFTLVELLIVIVIIAILAALVIVTFSGVQARARNTERQTDISALSKYLEIFYTNQSYYPPTGLIVAPATPTQVKDNLAQQGNASGLDVAALSAPGQTGNSFAAATSTGPNAYGYTTTAANCTGTTCTAYTLSWTEEASGTTPQTTKTKTSANN